MELYIFVLREQPGIKVLVKFIQDQFANCMILYLPNLARGALMSTLSAASIIHEFNKPIIVDLCDIDFKSNINIQGMFGESNVKAVLPVFQSNSEIFSYAVLDTSNPSVVIQTVEKKKISEWASAGVYIYRDLNSLLVAAQDSIEFHYHYEYNNNLFLCPSLNGLIRKGFKVIAVKVDDVNYDLGIIKNEGKK